ncbi:MAG: hypothetical protein ABI354_01415 [Candidatus Saccharimonadales bacterium]
MAPKIALDIDDVLANSTETIRLFVNKLRGTSLERHHYSIKAPYRSYYETVWSAHDIDGDGIIDEYYHKLIIDQSHVETIMGASDAIGSLINLGYRLVAVSSRSSDQQVATEKWIKGMFGDVFDTVICLDSWRNNITKGEICRSLGANYLIDDNVEHCKSALDYGVQPILFGEYGWQTGELVPEEVARCPDWESVLGYFNGRD